MPFLGFSMDREDIEVNLVSALSARGDSEQCLSLSLSLLALPPPAQGGVTTLLFSFVAWTPAMRKYVNVFGSQLVRAQELTLPRKKTLFDEVSSRQINIYMIQLSFFILCKRTVSCTCIANTI